MKKKVLIIHPSLVGGGAEKALINMLNAIDYTEFEVTLRTIQDEGVNRKYINENVKYEPFFKHHIKGYRYIFKLFTPRALFKVFAKERYDTIISYLEGPAARIVSGCDYSAKIISWLHTENNIYTEKAFRNKAEIIKSYTRINQIVCVSDDVKRSFNKFTGDLFVDKTVVIKNVLDTNDIYRKSNQKINDSFGGGAFVIASIGRLDKNKDHARMIPIIKNLLKKGINVQLNIIGIGDQYKNLVNEIEEKNLQNHIKLLGYQDNPYKYLSKSDLYVCCSHFEGYSTTVMEALLLKIPIVTTDCSGMKEILGSDCGVIVEDDDDQIEQAITKIIKDDSFRKKMKKAQENKISVILEERKDVIDSITKIL